MEGWNEAFLKLFWSRALEMFRFLGSLLDFICPSFSSFVDSSQVKEWKTFLRRSGTSVWESIDTIPAHNGRSSGILFAHISCQCLSDVHNLVSFQSVADCSMSKWNSTGFFLTKQSSSNIFDQDHYQEGVSSTRSAWWIRFPTVLRCQPNSIASFLADPLFSDDSDDATCLGLFKGPTAISEGLVLDGEEHSLLL